MRSEGRMQSSWWVGLISMITKVILLGSLLGIVGSCGKKPESDLVLKLSPNESLVLEMDAYSCGQVLDGIVTDTGTYVTPKYKGPVVQFNRFSMQWKKSTKLFVHQAKIKFLGSGIQGGEATCDLTSSLKEFFEREVTAQTQSPLNIYSGDTFLGAGTITSNPKCRVACSVPLTDPERPEITASGEITVKASELTNEGAEDEKYFRVKSNFRIRVVP